MIIFIPNCCYTVLLSEMCCIPIGVILITVRLYVKLFIGFNDRMRFAPIDSKESSDNFTSV